MIFLQVINKSIPFPEALTVPSASLFFFLWLWMGSHKFSYYICMQFFCSDILPYQSLRAAKTACWTEREKERELKHNYSITISINSFSAMALLESKPIMPKSYSFYRHDCFIQNMLITCEQFSKAAVEN